MKVREYIYQTGECLTHDTDVDALRPDTCVIALDLIRNGSGTLPINKSIQYSFSDNGNMAHLCVTGKRDEIMLMAEIVPCRGPYWPTMSNLDWAVKYLESVADDDVPKRLPDELATPCIVTLLSPGMRRLDSGTISALKNLRRDLACAWLTSRSEFLAPLVASGAIEPDLGMDESELEQIRGLLRQIQEGLYGENDVATVNYQRSALNVAVEQLTKAVRKSTDRERTKELSEMMMQAYRYCHELAKVLRGTN